MNSRILRIATALAFVLVPHQTLAEQATASRMIQAISLHDGPLDMVAYYLPARDGAFDVVATLAPRRLDQVHEPMRIVMSLADHDRVSFAMPGFRKAIYTFTRDGDAVTASVRPVELPRFSSPEFQAAYR